jgi:hypothetical protein
MNLNDVDDVSCDADDVGDDDSVFSQHVSWEHLLPW